VRAIKSGLWEEMLDLPVWKACLNAGRSADPSYALIVSKCENYLCFRGEAGLMACKKLKAANGIS